ncbi:hypothetical protein SYNPS1DRAFT_27850 [Syncephalis pseudoplumigaleata]|uniref:Uncharacterized protein n=1 Tax=Syncephalis pseudoplumigaleata TaxID=1712513 RepID=A0A4P9Z274_9FUNG|nr:hypothetical protein SYNPS1DRAFT_27850 [Syncephalis pseudoplumigaleata]|eukprot:RKP26455.1 hypothetical protein SYNPS1DRAFT_27850 [Syncephalis pseudoplumigaleata]
MRAHSRESESDQAMTARPLAASNGLEPTHPPSVDMPVSPADFINCYNGMLNDDNDDDDDRQGSEASSDSASSTSFSPSCLPRRHRRHRRHLDRARRGAPIGRGEQHVCAPLSRWEEKLRSERRQTIRLQRILFCLAAMLTFLPLLLLIPVAQPFWTIAIADLLLLMGTWSAIIVGGAGDVPVAIAAASIRAHLQLKLRKIARQQKRAHALRHVFRRHSHMAHQEHLHPAWMHGNGGSSGIYYNQDMRCVQLHLRSDDMDGPDPNAISPELLVMPPPAYFVATREPPAYVQEPDKPPRYAALAMDQANSVADHDRASTVIIQSAQL